MAAAWKPDGEPNNDGRVKFGQHARRWLGSRIRQELGRYLNGTAPTKRYGALVITGDEIGALVPWFMKNPMRYVRWISRDDYSGRLFSTGAWHFDADAVKGDVVRGMSELHDERARAADAGAVSTLDAWLRADMAGTLNYTGEKGGTEEMQLSHDERRGLSHAAMSRRSHWPRPCALCGGMFRNPAQGQKRCAACRAAKRSAKGNATGEPARQKRPEHVASAPDRLASPALTTDPGDEATFARTADEVMRRAFEVQRYALALLRSRDTGEDPGPPPWGGAEG